MPSLDPVEASDGPEAYRFCEQHPAACVYIAGWISGGGLANDSSVARGWLLAARNEHRRITGLVFLSATGIVIPHLPTSQGIDGIVSIARANANMLRVLVGERGLTHEIWEALTTLGFESRLMRAQQVYTVSREEFSAGPMIELRTANEMDLEAVVAASGAMAREEANDDPQARNASLFRERIRQRITRQRDFVLTDYGILVFKANVSALSPVGGQIEGIYTIPSRRLMQYGRRGTSTVTAWVLERTQRAVLLVNDDNSIARRLYSSLGYAAAHESTTIFVGP